MAVGGDACGELWESIGDGDRRKSILPIFFLTKIAGKIYMAIVILRTNEEY